MAKSPTNKCKAVYNEIFKYFHDHSSLVSDISYIEFYGLDTGGAYFTARGGNDFLVQRL